MFRQKIIGGETTQGKRHLKPLPASGRFAPWCLPWMTRMGAGCGWRRPNYQPDPRVWAGFNPDLNRLNPDLNEFIFDLNNFTLNLNRFKVDLNVFGPDLNRFIFQLNEFKPGPNQFRFALNPFKLDMNPFKSEADRFKSRMNTLPPAGSRFIPGLNVPFPYPGKSVPV